MVNQSIGIDRIDCSIAGAPLVFVISMGVIYAATDSFAVSGLVGAAVTLGYAVSACAYLAVLNRGERGLRGKSCV